MRSIAIRYALIGLVAVAIGSVLLLQHARHAALRMELALLSAQAGELAAVEAEHRQLLAERITATELERLRGDRMALGRLRAEVEALKSRSNELARASSAAAKPLEPARVPAAEWRNAGRATPEAALETALWAAAGGDIDALAATLSLSDNARLTAEAILASLPAAARVQAGSAERFIALMTAKSIPTAASLRVLGTKDEAGRATVAFELQESVDVGGRLRHVTRSKTLDLERESDGWRLLVPDAAVQKYGALLKAPLPPQATR